MKSHPVQISASVRLVVAWLAAGLLVPHAGAQFTQTGAGPFDYNTTGNWTGSTINGVFSQTPVAVQHVTFATDTTLTTGLTFSLGGTSPSLTLRANGTDRTVTLGGDVGVSGTTTSIVFGSTTAGNRLNFNLGGVDRTFTVAAGNTLYVNNVVSGGSALTKAGTGQLTLAGANTYTGTTTVNGGTVFLNASGALASGSKVALNSTTAGTTALLVLGSGFAQTIGALTFGGTGQTVTSTNNITLNAGSTLTLSGTVAYDATNNPTTTANITGTGTLALGANRTFDIADSTGNNSELNLYTPISGAGLSLTKTGAGRLALNGAGTTYDGGTIVNDGQIFLNASNTLAATGSVTVNNTVGAASTVILGVNFTQTIGALTFGGAGASAAASNSLFLHSGSTLTLNGTVTYDAANNPSGATISGPGTLALGGNLTFNVGNSSTTTTEINLLTVVSGSSQSLTKTGKGSLRLTGANTYDGGTTVSAGGLVVGNTTGSGVGTGALVVQAGAFLRGTGFIGGATTIQSGGILGTGGTGGTPGTLTFTSGLTLSDGAVFNFQLGTVSDKFKLTGGTLTGSAASGALTLNLTAGTGFGPGTYTLFDFSTGGTTNSFEVSDFTFGTTIDGYTYDLTIAGSLLQLTAVSAVPEPAAYAVILAVASLLGAARNRRWARVTPPKN